MTPDEYEKVGHLKYLRLAEIVGSVLRAAIGAETGLRLQQIQQRAKDPESLRKKLIPLGQSETTSVETAVKDLGGCRVVFYTNSDVDRFLSSGILRENFDIDWDRTKFHHPDSAELGEQSPFISHNFVVKLKDERVALPEYAPVASLWCEVQIQTILNHAWSEMEHDIGYKRPNLNGFGDQALTAISERMRSIMRKHLIPAGYEFQKVAYDFERLSKGLELFDRGALDSLVEAKDNNERFDLLERFVSYVLPNYDDPRGIYPEIRETLVTTVLAARATPVTPIGTTFGGIRGRTAAQVERQCANIFERLRYVDIEATFDTACELYLGATDDEGRKRWLHVIDVLARNEIDIWRQYGPVVQQRLVERIAALPEAKRDTLRPVVIPALHHALDPKISGTSSTYQTVTFHQGAVAASGILRDTRAKAIKLLKSLFSSDLPIEVQREIMRALNEATTTPYNASYSNDLLALILQNSKTVIEFYIEITNDIPFELRQTLERDAYFLYRRNAGIDTETEAFVAHDREALNQAIFAFRDRVNADQQFEIYKVLVGFESVFPDTWEKIELDYHADEAYRVRKYKEFIAIMTAENAGEWLEILNRCAKTESNDLATFPIFGQFLKGLGKEKPDIILGYIPKLDERLASFLPAMLDGLAESPRSVEADRLIKEWVTERRYLGQVMHYFRFAKWAGPQLLIDALTGAIETSNDSAVYSAVAAATAHHRNVAGGLIEPIMLPAIAYLTRNGIFGWVNDLWHSARSSTLIADLTEEQVDAVLNYIVQRPSVDYATEELLLALTSRWRVKLVDFFEARLQHEKSEGDEKYDAVPYQFHRLAAAGAAITMPLIERAVTWYQADPLLFPYRGGRVVSNFFPNFSEELRKALNAVIASDRENKVEFVLRIMRSYDGQAFLQPICKEIVAYLPEGDELLDEVEVILSSTGVVTGEFGFAEAYREKRRQISAWLEDPRTAVKTFAERYTRSLDRQIAMEQRRGEASLELRKREYGDLDASEE